MANTKDYYTCTMHPEIRQDKPGKCPKCGGMDLVKKSDLDSGHIEHDHASSMATPEAAADFLKRFLGKFFGILDGRQVHLLNIINQHPFN